MLYLLDTNICSYIIKKNPTRVFDKFKNYGTEDIAVSSLTLAEMQYGVAKSEYRQKAQRALDEFMRPLTVLDFNADAAVVYGEIRAHLTREGQLIGGMDMLIAAQAISANVTLVSNNMREFSRVPGLLIENWV